MEDVTRPTLADVPGASMSYFSCPRGCRLLCAWSFARVRLTPGPRVCPFGVSRALTFECSVRGKFTVTPMLGVEQVPIVARGKGSRCLPYTHEDTRKQSSPGIGRCSRTLGLRTLCLSPTDHYSVNCQRDTSRRLAGFHVVARPA